MPISILSFDIHGPPRPSWAPVRRTGCTPLSWGLTVGYKANPSVKASVVRRDVPFKSNIYEVVHDKEYYSPDQTVKRAQSHLGEHGYHVVTNNCEHFANLCVEGKAHSKQVGIAEEAVEMVDDAVEKVMDSFSTMGNLLKDAFN